MKLNDLNFTLLLGLFPCASFAAPPAAAALVAQENVDALIQQGRDKLDAGDAAAAETLFTRAATADGNTLKTRTWVLRSWIALGRVNDAYNAIDELAKTSQGPEIDYLYGMAFGCDARRGIESNGAGPFTGEKIRDALRFLDKALAADAARFRDATLLVCWAAWQTQELERGLAAAEQATQVWSSNPEGFYQLGRFGLARYQRERADETKIAAAEPLRAAAQKALERAEQMLAGVKAPAQRSLLARVSIDLGHSLQWKGELAPAATKYAQALGLDPTLVNFPQLLAVLGPEKLLAALDAGEQAFVATWGTDNPADAELCWWLGWARLQQKQYAEAEQAYAAAVKKMPAYVNSWFYIGLCRFSRQDHAGAIEALEKHFELDKQDLASTLQQNLPFNLPMLDALVGFSAGKNPPRNLDAAILSEAQALAKPDEVRFWNNAGLFYRDAGEPLGRSKDEKQLAQARELWERAYAAYSQALALVPDDPPILNDTAVMLHYYLHRDLERAKEMYKQATARAQVVLQQKDLSADRRELVQTALRDSKNNLAKLEKGDHTDG